MTSFATLSNSLMLMLLLGASDTLTGALGIALMFGTVVGLYSVCMLPLRSRLADKTVASVLLAVTLVSCAEIAAQRLALSWHSHMDLYAGLISLQCVVLEHNGFYRQPLIERLALSGLFIGLMLIIALLREGLNQRFHLATLTPGAFVLLGLLLAAHQAYRRNKPPLEETDRS